MLTYDHLKLAAAVIEGRTDEALALARATLEAQAENDRRNEEYERRRAEAARAEHLRREHNRKVREAHIPGLKKQIREAAKHLNGNASRLRRVAESGRPGVTYVGSSFSAVVAGIAENLIGHAGDTLAHEPDAGDVARTLAAIRRLRNTDGKTAEGND